jgi:hypothetical protein
VQLQALLTDRNTARKIVWRAEIVLATADGCVTNEIMRRANTSKPTVWRWQARYFDEGEGHLFGPCLIVGQIRLSVRDISDRRDSGNQEILEDSIVSTKRPCVPAPPIEGQGMRLDHPRTRFRS